MDPLMDMMAQAQAFAAQQGGSIGLPGGEDPHRAAAMLQASYYAPQQQIHQPAPRQQLLHHHTAAAAQGPPPQRAHAPHGDLHRLKVCGVPAGDFTDARLRQLFELCGKVRAGRGGAAPPRVPMPSTPGAKKPPARRRAFADWAAYAQAALQPGGPSWPRPRTRGRQRARGRPSAAGRRRPPLLRARRVALSAAAPAHTATSLAAGC